MESKQAGKDKKIENESNKAIKIHNGVELKKEG